MKFAILRFYKKWGFILIDFFPMFLHKSFAILMKNARLLWQQNPAALDHVCSSTVIV